MNLMTLDGQLHKDLFQKLEYVRSLKKPGQWHLVPGKDFEIQYYDFSIYNKEVPIVSISFNMSDYIYLSKILKALTNLDTRKTWDKYIVELEQINNIKCGWRSVFEFPLITAEFFEENLNVKYEDCVLISFRSLADMFEAREENVKCTNYFSMYLIKEVEGQTCIRIFFQIDMKAPLAILGKKMMVKRILDWAEAFRLHLEGTTTLKA